MGIINRRVIRGFALDDQCRDFGGILREIDGKGDPRRFCTGISDETGGGVSPSCKTCKAFVKNATPWNGERDGVLPGQISIDEYMEEIRKTEG